MITKKPDTQAQMIKQALAKNVSPRFDASTAIPNRAHITMELAKPFKPSIMFIELVMPDTEKDVKRTEIMVNCSNQSIPQTFVAVIA